jgi:6-phosphogluconate dehydrogenase (decarboxylating)
MTTALMQRFDSQGGADYTNRLLARMRQAFGGTRRDVEQTASRVSRSSDELRR